MIPNATPSEVAARLARSLGEPSADLVILAEGNVSVASSATQIVVKATGVHMSVATPADFTPLDLAPVLALVDNPESNDRDVDELFTQAQTEHGRRPSVEALLHAVCQDLPGIDVVAHTHPVAVNSLLCSDQAERLIDGSLFPDQIVVLGLNPVLVDYIDPGLKLAQEMRRILRSHLAQHGVAPKVIYLRNHGLFALGASDQECLQITSMAVKVARILLGASSAGSPAYMSENDANRINTRPDEELRRSLLRERSAQ